MTFDKDVETLIENTKERRPHLALAMERIVDGLEEVDDGYEVADDVDIPLSGRDYEAFLLAGAFGSALEREYPAPTTAGDSDE